MTISNFTGTDFSVYLSDKRFGDPTAKVNRLASILATSWIKDNFTAGSKARGTLVSLVINKFFDADIEGKYLHIYGVSEEGKTIIQSFFVTYLIGISTGVALDDMRLEEVINWEGRVESIYENE